MRYCQVLPLYASPFLLVAISADRYQVLLLCVVWKWLHRRSPFTTFLLEDLEDYASF